MRWLKLLTFAVTVAFLSTAAANAATPSGATVNPGAPSGVRVDAPFAMVIRTLDESAGKYQVEVQNENPTKFTSSFKWTPPSGLNVTAITGSVGGRCHLTGEGIIICTGLALPAGITTMGGSITVNFTATGHQPTWTGSYWIHYGVVGSVEVQQSRFNDLPLCKKGQKSSAAHPCATV